MSLGRILLLLAAAGVAAYYFWPVPAAPSAPPSPPPPAAAAPSPVAFPLKVRVKRLFEEWERFSVARSRGESESARVIMGAELLKLKESFHREGLHDTNSMRKEMVRAAAELGKAPEQAGYIIDKIFSLLEDESAAPGR